MSEPRVTCVIPMRNGGATIARTVASVRQPGVRVLVVDDGSTDDGGAIARSAGAEVVAGPGRGISAALNAGTEHVETPFWCRCDADDLYLPGRIARQVDYLDTHEHFIAVGGSHIIAEVGGGEITPWPMRPAAREITGDLQSGEGFVHLCACLVRTAVVRELGFRPFFETSEDADFLLRLGETGRVWMQAEAAYVYFLHEGGITQRSGEARRAWFARQAAMSQEMRQDPAKTDPIGTEHEPMPPEDLADGAADRLGDRITRLLMGRAHDCWQHGERAAAWSAAWRAVRRRPGSGKTWRLLGSVSLRRAPRRQEENGVLTPGRGRSDG